MSALVANLGLALSGPLSDDNAKSVIPYRSAASVPAGMLLTALGITALVLLVTVACIVYARRRGWLAGLRGKIGGSAGGGTIEVKTSRRLSMVTTLHVVAYGELEYLVVESARGTIASISPLGERQLKQDVES